MREFRLCFAIAFGIFFGLSGWSFLFPQHSLPAMSPAGYQLAQFGGCGDFSSPCYIKGDVTVELSQPLEIEPSSGWFPIRIAP
jgi:hypothetical protein